MNTMKKMKAAVLITSMLLLLCSCSKVSSKTVMVSADNVYSKMFTEDFISGFNKQNPGIKLEFVYGASADLKRGIENGDKADVFLSSVGTEMDTLKTQGLIDADSITPLCSNGIVLIASTDSPLSTVAPEEITAIKRFVFPDPDRVQSGADCKEALKDVGIWDTVRATAIYATSEPEVLNFVGTGEADAGLVYASTAAEASDRVKVLASVSGENYKGAALSGGVIKNSETATEAAKLIQYLKSDEVKGLFSEAGFTAVE